MTNEDRPTTPAATQYDGHVRREAIGFADYVEALGLVPESFRAPRMPKIPRVGRRATLDR